VVGCAGFVQCLQPGSGQAALYRLLDTLMETQVFATAAWKGIRHLPPRTLPAKALIVALTPLVDERGVAALFDLLARGSALGGGGREVGRAGPARVGPGARDPAPPLPAAGRGRGRVEPRHAPAAGAPGGGGMPAPRRARTPLACRVARH